MIGKESGQPDSCPSDTPLYYVYAGRTFLGLHYQRDRRQFEAFGQNGQALGSFIKAVDAVRAISDAADR